MKHGKKPTVAQKKMLKAWHLNPEDWLIVKKEADKITIVHRYTDKVRYIPQ